jgi:hypothetical protein
MRKPELAIAALGLIVATLALVPAFGQWLFPRDPVPVIPVAHLPTPSPTAAFLPAIETPTPTAGTTPTAESPTPTVAPAANLSPVSRIDPDCEAGRFLAIKVPLSPTVATYEADDEMEPYVQLAKELVVVAMELAIQAAADQDTDCVREIYSGAILNDLESLIFSANASGTINKPRIDWESSRLQDIRVRDVATFEVDVCLFQGLDVFNLQGQQIMTFPAELAAATYIFQRFEEGGRYYVTAILELDPLVLCQF